MKKLITVECNDPITKDKTKVFKSFLMHFNINLIFLSNAAKIEF